MIKHDEIAFEDAKHIYESIGFDLFEDLYIENNKIVESILKIGASALIIRENEEYEPNESSHDMVYTGVERKMYTPYVISRDDATIEAVVWIITSAVAALAHTDFKSYAISCVGALIGNFIPIVKQLDSQQKCVFFRIYYLYETYNKERGVSEEEIESFAIGNSNTPFCFISNQIKCDKRNHENSELCGEDFDVSSVTKNLLKMKIIKKVNGMFEPNAFFV